MHMHVDGLSKFLMTVLLSLIGSWYLQNNLSGALKGQLMDHITEHTKELFELRTIVNMQAEEIKQLTEDNKEQNKQIINQSKLIAELKIRVALLEKYAKVSKVGIQHKSS